MLGLLVPVWELEGVFVADDEGVPVVLLLGVPVCEGVSW